MTIFEFPEETRWVWLQHSANLALAVVLLLSGIGLLAWWQSGRRLALTAAAGQVLMGLIALITLIYGFTQDQAQSAQEQRLYLIIGFAGALFVEVLGLIYPTVLLILLGRRPRGATPPDPWIQPGPDGRCPTGNLSREEHMTNDSEKAMPAADVHQRDASGDHLSNQTSGVGPADAVQSHGLLTASRWRRPGRGLLGNDGLVGLGDRFAPGHPDCLCSWSCWLRPINRIRSWTSRACTWRATGCSSRFRPSWPPRYAQG